MSVCASDADAATKAQRHEGPQSLREASRLGDFVVSDHAAAVFLDKDGTLIEDLPYNVDPALIRLTHGAGEALLRLQAAGYKLIVVSNQSGVARGLFPEAALRPVEAQLRAMLGEYGVQLDGFYYCPHHPSGSVAEYAVECSCRKPAPGMLRRAAAEHQIALERSWMIGDILNDVEAGRRAGCRTILLDNGNETEWVLNRERLPDCVVGDLSAAAAQILCAGVATHNAHLGEALVKAEAEWLAEVTQQPVLAPKGS